jgi:hypothetical protein
MALPVFAFGTVSPTKASESEGDEHRDAVERREGKSETLDGSLRPPLH